MSKMTLLEMVQNILSALDSDEVTSINDTIEALQVATVIKETYLEQFNNIEIPEFRGLIKLDAVSDLSKPNYLKFPTNVDKVDWIKYRNDSNGGRFELVEYYTPEEFFSKISDNISTSDNVTSSEDPAGITYFIKDNQQPCFYTITDDNYLVFDSYDSALDSTLQSSKTFCYGTKQQSFVLEDAFIPVLDSSLFPLLLAEAKAVCFINFKQISSAKEEQRARRQRARMQNDQYKTRAAQKKARKQFNYARIR